MRDCSQGGILERDFRFRFIGTPIAKEGVIKEMKAIAVFPRTKEVKVIEHEAPRMTEPDQVKLRMLDIGIVWHRQRNLRL